MAKTLLWNMFCLGKKQGFWLPGQKHSFPPAHSKFFLPLSDRLREAQTQDLHEIFNIDI